MPRLAANLNFLFQELPLLDRFAAAAAAGFRAVELTNPYEARAEAIAERLTGHRLTLALLNMPAGDGARGERGFGALPGREAEFMRGAERALSYARITQCPRVHALSGVWPTGRSKTEGAAVLAANLRRGSELFAGNGVGLTIEPINPRDIPGYFLNTPDEALAILDGVARDNVGLQLDLYHCQIVAGDLAGHLRRLAGRYVHVQIAGVPERHEPDRGEVNYPYLFDLLDTLGYAGWVGCEYRPAAGTVQGLGWAQRWLEGTA
jgi:2-dehydrotetronate isomerase